MATAAGRRKARRVAARRGSAHPTRRAAVVLALGELLESLPLAACVIDADARVLYWNGRAELLFGWSAAEVVGRTTPLVPASELPALRGRIRGELAFVGQVEAQATRQRKGGGTVEVAVYSSPLRDARGRVVSMIRMFTDLAVQERDKRRSREAGAADFIQRPIEPQEFIARVEACMRGSA